MTASKGTYIARGNQKYQMATTQVFNIDNGSGTTVDDQLLYCFNDVILVDAKVVYTEATDTTGAATANVKVGTTAGGAEVVTATNLAVSKAVGDTTALTLNLNFVAAGTTIRVRHTGRAATEAGQYYVALRYYYK
jgi:poly(3-hydroxyalkanoate) synthetase